MLRLMGGILLLLGCVGYSRAFCRERRQKILRLREIKKMYELLYSQIGCFMAAFPEACRAVAGRMEGNLADMLHAIWAEAEKNDGRTLLVIWKEQAQSCNRLLSLKGEDEIWLMDFSENLGYADGILQRQVIENMLLSLSERIKELEEGRAGYEKLTMSFGIMGGLLLLIVLI